MLCFPSVPALLPNLSEMSGFVETRTATSNESVHESSETRNSWTYTSTTLGTNTFYVSKQLNRVFPQQAQQVHSSLACAKTTEILCVAMFRALAVTVVQVPLLHTREEH